jgi:putative integral membrane protein (TIGR02587 family)
VPRKRRRQFKFSSARSQEINDLIKGASGGFLFGVPLLYTMEVWFIGSQVEPLVLLYILGSTYTVIFLLTRTEGFRRNKSKHLTETAIESIEALAIGIICATLMLILLQQINRSTSLHEGLGKIVFEGVPFSIGVALSRSILRGDRELSKPSTTDNSQPFSSNKKAGDGGVCQDTLSDLSATLIGATIIAFAIAPTDEVPMLAASTSPPWLLAIVATSLIISYGIVFIAGFSNQKKRRQQQGFFQRPSGETVFSYLVSLLAAVLMLWFFHQLSWDDPWQLWLRYTLILGLPATIGGAAGRIAI